MARHRWATGESTPGPDRLDRVLNLNRAERDTEAEPDTGGEPGAEASWPEFGWTATTDDGAGDSADHPTSDSAGSRFSSGVARTGLPLAERGRSGRRWVATRRAALVAAGCALVVGGWQFVSTDHEDPQVVPIMPPASAGDADSAGGAESPAEAAAPVEEAKDTGATGQGSGGAQGETVVVHVAGAVQAPGVVETAAGSRVFEVLEKAGGALPEAELSAVNLAAVVQDGQQILIPRAGEPLPPAGGAPEPEPGTRGSLVNLNTADLPELEELPRVGPVLAERIVEWRTQHGPFARPEDLDAVPGIGPAMLESLVPLVTV